MIVLTAYAAKPLKWIWLGVLYTAIGALAIFLLNAVGGHWGFHLPINPVTAFITGVLGVPGIVCLILVKLLIVGE